MNKGNLGLTLSSKQGTPGGAAHEAIVEEWEAIFEELGGQPALLTFGDDPRPRINENRHFGNLGEEATRNVGFEWLAERLNVWVNVLRPKVRSLVAEATDDRNI